MDIEEVAVQRVKREILKYDCLKDYINTNDKTPMWDGEIYVYNENSKYKANGDFMGKISVQVKGHKVTKIKSGNSKYSIDVEYLRAYQKDKKGVLLFVVEMTDSENTQIYYANLLPVDLKDLLNHVKEKQKSITIDIKPVREKSPSSMKMLCQNFLKNSNEQMNIEIKNIDEIKNIKEISFSVVGEERYFEDYIFNNDIYSYAIEKETNRKYALPKFLEIQRYQTNKVSVKIGEKEYYNKINIIKNKNEEYILCGKSIKIYKKSMNFRIKGNVYERINDINFILAVLEEKKVNVNGMDIKLSINVEHEKKKKYKNSIEKDLIRLNKIKELFEKFKINFDVDLDQLCEQDLNNLTKLIKLNDGILIENIKDSNLYYIEISTLCIAFLIIVDKNNKVNLYNYFSDLSDKMKVFYYDKNGKEMTISPYINLTLENLITLSNINIDIMKKSLDAVEYTEETCSRYNLWLLELIKAYDKTKEQKWLEFAEFLIDKILTFSHSALYIINKLQIIKRTRKLNREEKNRLYEMKEKENDNMIQCGIAILLDNLSDFERFFDKLENKEEFKNFPIYNLMKK